MSGIMSMVVIGLASSKTEPAPYAVSMEITIPYTDTFTGNMPFSFGLADVS